MRQSISELRNVTYDMGSHSYLPPDTDDNTSLNPSQMLILDLSTPRDGRLSWP